MIVGLLPHRARFIQAKNGELEDALKRWNIRLAFVRQTDFRDEEEDQLTPGWPMYFAEAKGWDTLREDRGKPVVIQKTMGQGSVVVMTNSFLLSNAALVEDRQTAFLANLNAIAEKVKAEAQKAWADPIVTEIAPLKAFYKAEDYHQDYFAKNPEQGYCRLVVAPKVKKFEKLLQEQKQ